VSIEHQGSEVWVPRLTCPIVPGEPRWYAVHTRCQHDKKVARQLTEEGIVTFLPLMLVPHRWSDRKKIVEVPLFPGYLFVRIAWSVQMQLCVLRVPGVAGFVGVKGHGTPIPDEQILDLQTVLSHKLHCECRPLLQEGQRVRVRGGCLDGVEGVLVQGFSDRSLVLSVDAIQRSIIIRINGYEIEPV
jgi:transcription termination/antitermination protein NusG